jgi:hypothetical protein
MTKQRATFTPKELERAVHKEMHWKIGATSEPKRSVGLQRAQFVNGILSHTGPCVLATRLRSGHHPVGIVAPAEPVVHRLQAVLPHTEPTSRFDQLENGSFGAAPRTISAGSVQFDSRPPSTRRYRVAPRRREGQAPHS